jgi:hypothetical protein
VILGFDPAKTFEVPEGVLPHAREVGARGAAAHSTWNEGLEAWRAANPQRAADFDRIAKRELPAGWDEKLPAFPAGKDVATRKASEAAIQAIAEQLPEFWGGSADLAGSTNTTIKGGLSFLPYFEEGGEFGGSSPYGRILHFGIREHAMGSILNGIALHGNTRVFGATFLQFSDYMRPPVRLASMMQAPTTYVWTHDSIGLGEDGPTHQPVEHYAALRAIPGFHFVRPADANETVAAWKATLEQHGPVGLALTRQNVPVFDHDALGSAVSVTEGVKRGGYVLAEATGGAPKVILIGTGSEVQLAVEARERLEASGVPTRVVSMPCTEWFEAQDAGYRESVLPTAVKARVAVEAGIAQPWYRYAGDAGTHRLAGALRRLRRLQDAVHRVRHHRRGRRGGRARVAGRGRGLRNQRGEEDDLREPQEAVRRRRLDLARRPVPRPAAHRQPGRAGQGQARHRRHHQPDHLPEGHLGLDHLRRAGQGPGRARGDRGRGGPDDHHPRRARRGRRAAPGLRGHRRRGRPGLDRGRPAPGAQDRPDDRRGQAAVRGWWTGTTC